jgi:uncharacterized membrane protein
MYLALKTLHILSSTVLFGTGLGTAFFMWMTNRGGNRQAIAIVSGLVMKADLIFTTPAVILQPLSGFGLMLLAGFQAGLRPLNWLGLSVLLYLLAGACWLPVLWLQWKMHKIAAAAPGESELPPLYWQYENIWTILGFPAFLSLIVVFWLMAVKPF